MLQLLYNSSSVFWSVDVAHSSKSGPKMTFTFSEPDSWLWPVEYKKRRAGGQLGTSGLLVTFGTETKASNIWMICGGS